MISGITLSFLGRDENMAAMIFEDLNLKRLLLSNRFKGVDQVIVGDLIKASLVLNCGYKSLLDHNMDEESKNILLDPNYTLLVPNMFEVDLSYISTVTEKNGGIRFVFKKIVPIEIAHDET